jgi:hypothetical protein
MPQRMDGGGLFDAGFSFGALEDPLDGTGINRFVGPASWKKPLLRAVRFVIVPQFL